MSSISEVVTGLAHRIFNFNISIGVQKKEEIIRLLKKVESNMVGVGYMKEYEWS